MTRRIAQAVTYILFALILALAMTVTITAGIFWATIACVAVASLVILTYQFRKAWAEKSAGLDAFLADEPTVRIMCDLESCGEPSVVEFAGGAGPLYICAKHAGPVSAWAPVVGVWMPYDQEASA